MSDHIVIAIDGPAGAGKSSVSKGVAEKLNIFFLDTGAMYRALTLKAIRLGVELTDEQALADLAAQTTVELKDDNGVADVLLDGQSVREEIRSPKITNNAFYIAQAPKVRSILVGWQQEIGKTQSLVAEGRDTTTVVFPNATYKFYMDASIEERARRRKEELEAKGEVIDMEQMRNDIETRDNKDFSREVGPLKRSDDQIYVDTSGMSVDQSVTAMLKFIKRD